ASVSHLYPHAEDAEYRHRSCRGAGGSGKADARTEATAAGPDVIVWLGLHTNLERICEERRRSTILPFLLTMILWASRSSSSSNSNSYVCLRYCGFLID